MGDSNKFYAVIGAPVEHSLSPRLFELFAEQTGIAVPYKKLTCDPTHFKKSLQAWKQQGLVGANITVPFKEAVVDVCTSLSAMAAQIGAVNAITLNEQGWAGDNTDSPGLLKALEHEKVLRKDARILVIGAGGAARGVLASLSGHSLACLGVYNRTSARAKVLAQTFVGVDPISEGALSTFRWDGIIDATSAVTEFCVPVSCKDAWVMTLNYGSRADAVHRWANDGGALKFIDGLRMLVEQAALSYFIWTGVTVDTTAVMNALKNHGSH